MVTGGPAELCLSGGDGPRSAPETRIELTALGQGWLRFQPAATIMTAAFSPAITVGAWVLVRDGRKYDASGP